MKQLLKKKVYVVKCPKTGKLGFVGEVNVPKTEVRCRECESYVKETCGYLKCREAI